MSMNSKLRPALRRLCCAPVINALLVPIWRIFRGVLPKKVYRRFPVIGRLRIKIPGPGEKDMILLNNGLDHVANNVYWSGIEGYEPSTMKLFRQLTVDSSVIFDIGAYHGLFAILASLDNPASRIFAFEPVPYLFERLQSNVHANNLENVYLFSDAVSNTDGTTTLYVPPFNQNTSASIQEGFRENCVSVEVEMVALDTFVNKHQIDKIDLIKIDTETTEFMVFQGATEVLITHRPIIICEVLHGFPEMEEKLNAVLSGKGYVYYLLTESGPQRRERISGVRHGGNYLFVPKEWLKEHGEAYGIGLPSEFGVAD